MAQIDGKLEISFEDPKSDRQLTLRRVASIAPGTVSDSRSDSGSNRISAARERIQPGTARVPVPSRPEDECGIRNDLLGRSGELYGFSISIANRSSSSIGLASGASISIIVSADSLGVNLAIATVHPSVNTRSITRSVRIPAGGRTPSCDPDAGGIYVA